jgi:uncharacterized protein YjbI with pentapeptide repeats
MEIKVTARSVQPIRVSEISTDLTGVRFPDHEAWVNIGAVSMTDVDFGGQKFDPFNAIGTTFVRCRFDRAHLRTGILGTVREETPPSRFVDCTFDRTRFGRDVQLNDSRFERCTFTNVKVRGWQAFHAEFIDCVFTGELRDCWFTGMTKRAMFPKRERNEFRGNDFSHAELIDCSFNYGIDIHAQRWPNGPGYVVLDRFHERITAARAAIARWSDDLAREQALARLRIMADRAMESQDSAFLRREDWVRNLPDVRDAMFRLLEADLDDLTT